MSYENIAVKDACVLFDLIDLKLLNDYFQLGYKTFITSYVYNEITEVYQKAIIRSSIEKGSLIIDDELNDSKVFELSMSLKGLSMTDCSVIEVALRRRAFLLSSDKGLRNEALRQNIKIGGVIWVIQKLLGSKLIDTNDAIQKLEEYMEINSRAPVREVSKLILKLKKL